MKKAYSTPRIGNLAMVTGEVLVVCSASEAHEDAPSFARETNGGGFWDETEK